MLYLVEEMTVARKTVIHQSTVEATGMANAKVRAEKAREYSSTLLTIREAGSREGFYKKGRRWFPMEFPNDD